MSMRIECPCGTLLTDSGALLPNFADYLPDVNNDAFLDAVENAIAGHEKENAAQWVVLATADFFRQMCQCPSCGRIFIEDERYKCHEFVPANASVRKDVLSKPRNYAENECEKGDSVDFKPN